MVRYADASRFVNMLRSGKRADGSPIKVMPLGSLKERTNTGAQAL